MIPSNAPWILSGVLAILASAGEGQTVATDHRSQQDTCLQTSALLLQKSLKKKRVGLPSNDTVRICRQICGCRTRTSWVRQSRRWHRGGELLLMMVARHYGHVSHIVPSTTISIDRQWLGPGVCTVCDNTPDTSHIRVQEYGHSPA